MGGSVKFAIVGLVTDQAPDTDPRPLYVQVAADLRRAIREGEFPVGSKVPSRRQISERYRVSAVTAAQAVSLLKAEGVVVGHQGRGTYVRGEVGPERDLSAEVTDLYALVDQLHERVTRVEQRYEDG